MKRKIIKLSFVLLCSAVLTLLAGSMPIPDQRTQTPCDKELEKLNDATKKHLNLDISEIQRKNPLILLEFSVE